MGHLRGDRPLLGNLPNDSVEREELVAGVHPGQDRASSPATSASTPTPIAVVQELTALLRPREGVHAAVPAQRHPRRPADDSPGARQALRRRRVHPGADCRQRLQGIQQAPPTPTTTTAIVGGSRYNLLPRVRAYTPEPAPDGKDGATVAKHYQYVFIGSGVAGATVAKRCSNTTPIDVDPDARCRPGGQGQGPPVLVGLRDLRLASPTTTATT